jgi:hypothetical protein
MAQGAYDIQVDSGRRIVVATITGDFDLNIAKAMTEAARTAAHEHEFHLLYDFRGAVILVERGEMFWFPRKLEILKTPGAGRFRAAILVNVAQRELAAFLENAFQNAGLQLRVFDAEPEALAWLAEAKA